MSQTLPKLSHRLVDEAQYNLLRSVGYLSSDDRRDIIDACEFGDIAHIKDKRKSGEPYITHPIAVAEILAGFRLDRDTINYCRDFARYCRRYRSDRRAD